MSFFDDNFSGVRKMLEADRERANSTATKPWRVMGLVLGRPKVESEHDTEGGARDELAAIHRTCAPFVRDSFWVEGPNGRL